ncbi:MAG TPA: sugar phosphate isomerase/epimerase [Planctomycetes bacterium]|nr:sugar phosphate isomerase/epimerase [Planctomycetota bacterium]
MRKAVLSRREAFGASAAVALSGLWAARGRGGQPAPSRITIGISTLGFSELTNAQLAAELAEAGIGTVQLFLNQADSRYWRYNGRVELGELSPARCRAIAQAYRSAGLEIHSMGVYTNLIHPDAGERQANLAYFEGMMRVGREMGVRRFVTESGYYEPPKPSRLSYHFREAVWKQMLTTVGRLAEVAERYQATVLLEPFFGDFLTTAKRTRVFLEEINSPRIRALLDPANLLEVNDLEEMFGQLGPWIDCLHAKDRKLHGDRGVAAGQGDLDYVRFVQLIARHTPQAPVILEYVGPDNYRQALEHLRGAIRRAGAAAS